MGRYFKREAALSLFLEEGMVPKRGHEVWSAMQERHKDHKQEFGGGSMIRIT